MGIVQFDSRGVASLDGCWDLFPGDHSLDELDGLEPQPITVPGLWEAQGYLELDGVVWYRRTFALEEVEGHWTLHFGAVMDIADVYVNGVHVGRHEAPFTPFDLDVAALLVPGENVLAVRVYDPALGDPEHTRMPHGKQGWMNHVFPSRPSLYMTYGGIWQSVTLRRHGPIVVRNVFVNGDPDDVVVEVELENREDEPVDARVGIRTLGRVIDVSETVPGRGVTAVKAGLGRTTAARWSPASPELHDVLVDARAAGASSDVHSTRYGLRTVRVEGSRMFVNGEPYRMKSVLVQGFTANELYAEGPRDEIEREVRAAKDMGFNTLRLHIKAFHPTYLDVCDEVGIWVHCDLPVAEPIEHHELGRDTLVARRCINAVNEQVRRDRNHPSIILWSAMNELCDGLHEARSWDAYEEFARALVAAVNDADGTRPVIENDWIEPDPDRIFASPFMTAHWYGRLHRDYLDKIERNSKKFSGTGRVFFVSEYGDWGLPEMPDLADPPFWDTRETYAVGLAGTLWPATIGRFLLETQRYQGLSDRLQTEVWRRHHDISGYCLTELTDVPHELNGLLDLHRRPKLLAVAEVTRANQVVLPMLELDSLVGAAGQVLRATVHVSNDGPPLEDVTIEARFGETATPLDIDELLAMDASDLHHSHVLDRFSESVAEVRVSMLEGYRPTELGELTIVVPDVPGSHDLVLRLRCGDTPVCENRYPIHVVDPQPLIDAGLRVIGGGADALRSVGAIVGDTGPLVIGEGSLDEAAGAAARAALDAGHTVVILAQPEEAAQHYPLPVSLVTVATVWGSTQFHFTTDHGAVPSLPRRNVLVAEDSTIQAATVVGSVDGAPFPDTPVVIAYKPVPGALTGTVLGSHAVGRGRLVFCQYRLTDRAASGDAAACALLADILRWAAAPRPVMGREAVTKDDGRQLFAYSWRDEAA
ncbi:MAG TPA: glycoside hydrolase family 2 TIM barrel-domain containing protein, partial [Acidimicrobiales bacterium]|nr:glycoside hydrolase family 2 TIM barrel-domain containing protein [Acidimicrobiales bacterium]